MHLKLMHPAIGELTVPFVPERGAILGRAGGPELDLELNWDPRVSRRHARIVLEGGTAYVEDLGSRNGVWHGATRIEGRHRLDPGTTVIVGETVVFAPEEGSAPAWSLQNMDLYAAPTSSATQDLPTSAVLEGGEAKRTREHPRFVARDRVEVKIAERDHLKQLWLHDISKGGLYVATEDPPALHAKLEVRIAVDNDVLALRAVVVHVVDPATAKRIGLPSGVGLQFVDLLLAHKKAIEAYVDGLAERLRTSLPPPGPTESAPPARPVGATQPPPAVPPASTPPRGMRPKGGSIPPTWTPGRGTSIPPGRTPRPTPRPTSAAAPPPPPDPDAKAQRVLGGMEKNDLYWALELDPLASQETLLARLREWKALFGQALSVASEAGKPRFEAALEAVERIVAAFADPGRRLEYDFRNGHVRSAERIAAAKTNAGPSLAELRRAWHAAQPEQVVRAAFLTRMAFAARQRGEIGEAVIAGQKALAHNPFVEELHQNVKAWENLNKKMR